MRRWGCQGPGCIHHVPAMWSTPQKRPNNPGAGAKRLLEKHANNKECREYSQQQATGRRSIRLPPKTTSFPKGLLGCVPGVAVPSLELEGLGKWSSWTSKPPEEDATCSPSQHTPALLGLNRRCPGLRQHRATSICERWGRGGRRWPSHLSGKGPSTFISHVLLFLFESFPVST